MRYAASDDMRYTNDDMRPLSFPYTPIYYFLDDSLCCIFNV
jgi:hypothetical protein